MARNSVDSGAPLFLPGWGATAGLYRAGLPEGWEALEYPAFRVTRGAVAAYRCCVLDELASRSSPVTLAGHSMGAALAVLATADRPERVARLILLAPAGLPLVKPLTASAVTFMGQVAHCRYPVGELRRSIANALTAPHAAFRLARQVHDLDLTRELERIRGGETRCTVIGCAEDRLATPEHCRRFASLLDANYREVHARDGHIWPITDPVRLRVELERVNGRLSTSGIPGS